MPKNIFFALGLVLIIIVGVLWLALQPREPETTDLSAIEAGISSMEDSAQAQAQSDSEPPSTQGESTSLQAVGEYTGTGLATRFIVSDTFRHTVFADLDDPPEGKFYEGWLVKPEPQLAFFSTGRLERINGQYALEYTAGTDALDYPQVVITQETEADGLDGVPEDHVLEGRFTP